MERPPRAAQYLVVEMDGSPKDGNLDQETKAAILALAGNPGFRALLDRLKLQRGVLLTMLMQGKYKSLDEVKFIQAGIFWADWLDTEVRNALKMEATKREPRAATPYEEEQFNKIRQQLEIVGANGAA